MVFNIGDQVLWDNSTSVCLVKKFNQAAGDYLIGIPDTEEYDVWASPLEIKHFSTMFSFLEKVNVITRTGLGTVKGIQAFLGFSTQTVIQYHIIFGDEDYPQVYSENELIKYVPVKYISWSKLGISTDPKTLGYRFSQ